MGRFTRWLAAAVTLFGAWVLPAIAQDTVWTVAKSSGESWIGSAAHPASITLQAQLRPGDSIRTGRNGRVLLVRGHETILVSPNSAISLPGAGRPGLSTVIQQAGTIMLDVEKRNVQHFEVETPYLAAVVKGTRFRVSVVGGQTKVDVVRGQVQVTDFRSGELALVNPQQFARSSSGGAAGLKMGGRGELGTVLRGPSQTPRVPALPVPSGGLKPDPGAVPIRSISSTTSAGVPSLPVASQPVIARTPGGGARIVAPIGELNLNIRDVTKGMARSDGGDNARGKSWTTRLQPGNGGNDIRLDNSGSAKPIGTGPSSESAVSTAAAGGESAAGSTIIPNAVTNGGGGMGGGNGNGGKGGSGKDGGGKGVGAKDNSGKGSGGDDGPGGKSRGGPAGPGGPIAGGLAALIENRGRGNAYGLNGGNGHGKALGLGKKN